MYMTKHESADTRDSDRPALNEQTSVVVTPEMIEAGVRAFDRFFDPDQDSSDSLRATISAVISAALDPLNHRTDFDGSVARKLGGSDEL